MDILGVRRAMIYISSFQNRWMEGCQSQRPRIVKLLLRRDLSCSLKHHGSEAAIFKERSTWSISQLKKKSITTSQPCSSHS